MTDERQLVDDDAAFQEWSEQIEASLVPMLRECEITVALVPRGQTDAKFAVELGFMIMMDKPIIALIAPGVIMPPKLARVVDRVIESGGPGEAGMALTAQRLRQALRDLIAPGTGRPPVNDED